MIKIKLHGELKKNLGDRADLFVDTNEPHEPLGQVIATKEQYEREASVAHCYPDGVVRRRGEAIGHRSDIEIISGVENEKDLH